MFSQNTNRRIATLVGVAAPAILVTNIAFAAWTASGEGFGAAVAGDPVELTIDAGTVADTVDMLYPNNSGDVRFTINNPNPYDVDIETVDFTNIVGGSGDCDDSVVSFENIDDLNMVVGAGASLVVNAVDLASMTNDAHDDCQGATFTADVTLTGLSIASGSAQATGTHPAS